MGMPQCYILGVSTFFPKCFYMSLICVSKGVPGDSQGSSMFPGGLKDIPRGFRIMKGYFKGVSIML